MVVVGSLLGTGYWVLGTGYWVRVTFQSAGSLMKDEGYSPFSVLHLRLNPTYSPGGACVRELLVLGRFSVLDVNNFF